MNEGRAILVLALFVGSIVAGAVVQRTTESGVKDNPYAQLDKMDEPQPTAEVAQAILNSDAKTLARLMDNETLTALREALMSPTGAPIADVRSVRFVGATGKANKVLAGYILSGRDMGGTDAIVGFVLNVENGQIVGVN
ncbi:MAG TPA: hypothetical protein VM052_03830 [Candidatus Limnocylindrales bacterium]|nr:hypothetical protein [Candidatus Limnocylindrales bacterium]